MRRLLALPALLCTLSPAAASGGLWCDVDDDKVTIAINSGVTRGMGGPLFNFEATVEIKDPELPDDVRKTSFGHATQYWLDGEALNLLVYWERDGDGEFASVEATVMTRYADEEGSYDGEYAITIYGGKPTADGEALRYSGAISCGVE
jgi:hypothetical protein